MSPGRHWGWHWDQHQSGSGTPLGPAWGQPRGRTAAASPGVTVPVSPQSSLEDGRIVDTSLSRDPFQVELGKRQVIPGEPGAGGGFNRDPAGPWDAPGQPRSPLSPLSS